MARWSGRLLVRAGVFSAAALTALIVAGLGYLAGERFFATKEWESLGGTISVDEDFLLGPRTISFGAAVGKPVSPDIMLVGKSLQRMRKLPLCRSLALQNLGDASLIDTAIQSFDPIDLTVGHCKFDDGSLKKLASCKSLRILSAGNCPITFNGVDELLRSHHLSHIRLSYCDITEEEEDELKRTYGDRVRILRLEADLTTPLAR